MSPYTRGGFTYLDITIIIGAGASKAFTVSPYPLLSKMLEEMFQFAKELPTSMNHKKDCERYLSKQRLYLSYAIKKALNDSVKEFETRRVKNNEIEDHFFQTHKRIQQNGYSIDKIFEELEKQDYNSSTKAHWALTHAIGFYMVQMRAMRDANEYEDRAHIELIRLIEKKLKSGHSVSVIDFNYDCLIERIRDEYSGSSNATFGWDVGRKRKVIKDDYSLCPSDLVRKCQFMEPLDERDFRIKAKLIKPHGDMCSFLKGNTEIYYKGGRHSQSTISIFPEKLSDITEGDTFLRSSIMPPTKSRRRHSSKFYDKESHRFRSALKASDIFIIIGWSAQGSDTFYDCVFRGCKESFEEHKPKVFIIDKKDTTSRIKELFGSNSQVNYLCTCGFKEESICELSRCIERAVKGKMS